MSEKNCDALQMYVETEKPQLTPEQQQAEHEKILKERQKIAEIQSRTGLKDYRWYSHQEEEMLIWENRNPCDETQTKWFQKEGNISTLKNIWQGFKKFMIWEK